MDDGRIDTTKKQNDDLVAALREIADDEMSIHAGIIAARALKEAGL